MAEVAGDDLFGEDGDSDSPGGDVPDEPPAKDIHAPCGAKPEERGVLQRAAMVEAMVPSADAPEEAQEHEDGSREGGEEKVRDDAIAARIRPRKQLPGKPPDEAIQAVATSVGKGGGDVWEGVKRGPCYSPGGVIVKIRWANMDLKGSLPVADWCMPHLTEFDVSSNHSLTGRIDEVQWPENLISINMYSCFALTGDISKVVWPEGLAAIFLYECKGITGLEKLDLRYCRGLIGDLSKVIWPEGLTEIHLYGCTGITGNKVAARAKLEAAGCSVYGL